MFLTVCAVSALMEMPGFYQHLHLFCWLRREDSNLRSPGYEPGEWFESILFFGGFIMSSVASSRPFYVVVLEHEVSDGYESYYCPNLETAKAVLQSAYQAGARVVRVSVGSQVAQHSYPLDITVLTDTDN